MPQYRTLQAHTHARTHAHTHASHVHKQTHAVRSPIKSTMLDDLTGEPLMQRPDGAYPPRLLRAYR